MRAAVVSSLVLCCWVKAAAGTFRGGLGSVDGSTTASARRSLELDESSQLISLAPDGVSLVYDGYQNQNGPADNRINGGSTNTVPDFSSAGYRRGGVPIPFVPAAVTVSATDGDDGAAIQAAIDTVSALPLVDGFRGAILLKAGQYRVSNQLTISASGVVIRGEGSGSGGTTITYTNNTQSTMLVIAGGNIGPQPNGTIVRVDDDFVPTGATTFGVTPGHSFSVGTDIIVRMTPNQAWLDDMGDMGQFGWTPSTYLLKWRRTVTSVTNDQITIDSPIVQAIDTVLYGGADVYAYTFDGEIENVGVENIRLESLFLWYAPWDEDHGWKAIQMIGVKNAWVRQVTGKYFGFGLVSIERFSSHITIEDSAMIEYRSRVTGGRRYSFYVHDSDFVLVQRCFGQSGRHDFVSGSRTPGPNVFVDNLAVDSTSDIGPHHRYATGQLYDNIRSLTKEGSYGEIHVQNRESLGSGHGWAGAQTMFWNCEGSIICDAPNNAMNFAVGNVGPHSITNVGIEKKRGIWRSIGTHVTPRSLYFAQIKDRLGLNGLRHVVLPAQEVGAIWTQLNSWYGDGLLLDPVVTFLDEESLPVEENLLIEIGGIVRDLTLLGNSPSFSWGFISGPGAVSFGDDNALETTASFALEGTYALQLTVSDAAGAAHSAPLSVEVVPRQSEWPSSAPSISPTASQAPSNLPSSSPSLAPTNFPTTLAPSSIPSAAPSNYPSTIPSIAPSSSPTTVVPTTIQRISPANAAQFTSPGHRCTAYPVMVVGFLSMLVMASTIVSDFLS